MFKYWRVNPGWWFSCLEHHPVHQRVQVLSQSGHMTSLRVDLRSGCLLEHLSLPPSSLSLESRNISSVRIKWLNKYLRVIGDTMSLYFLSKLCILPCTMCTHIFVRIIYGLLCPWSVIIILIYIFPWKLGENVHVTHSKIGTFSLGNLTPHLPH